jgi:site-specific DNA-methyltransferase (adenine-specific)
MEYMAQLRDMEFDLSIVDPPYGIGECGNKSASRSRLPGKPKQYKPYLGLDKSPPGPEYFKQLIRVSKNQIIFGANHFCDRFDASSAGWIVWDKDNGESDFADCELVYTSFNRAVRKFKYRWAGFLQGNMKDREERIHPTQKPVALYRWILDKYAKRGQRILDTHIGSGSIAIAAHYCGVDLVGCELDKHYHKKACDRFEMETKQLGLRI